jgi:hypothetical protein
MERNEQIFRTAVAFRTGADVKELALSPISRWATSNAMDPVLPIDDSLRFTTKTSRRPILPAPAPYPKAISGGVE